MTHEMSYRLETYTEKTLSSLRRSVDRKELSLEEEMALKTFYLVSIEKICEINKFSLHTIYLSTRLFQLFFLENTIEEKDGKSFACACVFIAAKCTNKHIKISDLTKNILNCDNDMILQIEKEILKKTFSFLWIPDPLSVLLGFSVHIKEYIPNKAILDLLIENTKKQFLVSIKTDAILIATTSQLIGCIFIIEAQKKDISLNGVDSLQGIMFLVPVIEKHILNFRIPEKSSLKNLAPYNKRSK